MSEEAPLRDRSHIEKTLMLDEDKPADDYSGNQRKKEPAGAGRTLGAGALRQAGTPARRALEMGSPWRRLCKQDPRLGVKGSRLAGRKKGDPSRRTSERVEGKSQCCVQAQCQPLWCGLGGGVNRVHHICFDFYSL